MQLIETSWLVLGDMGVFLLLGFLVAGVLSVCIPSAWIERHLGGRGLLPALKASLFGVPLPLCSCGVIPVAASMRRHGASRSATAAFLLSTPQTGVDSIAVTYALLGPIFAVFRPIAALLTGWIGGGLIQAFDQNGETANSEPSEPAACDDACCDEAPSRNAILRILHYGLIVLPRDIGPALMIGVLITGVMMIFVPEDQLEGYIDGGILSMLLMIVVGIPFYVCATASVPIAVGLIHMGASPGAALAFLIAGPATNAAAFTTIWKVLGRRSALIYIATVVVGAVVCGLALDAMVVDFQLPQVADAGHQHEEMSGGWMSHLGAVTLLMVLAVSSKSAARLWGKRQHEHDDPAAHSAETAAQQLQLSISGMRCSQCVMAIQRGLAECDGVETAEVDLDAGRAAVVGNGLDRQQLVEVVESLGYQVVEGER